jgi:hypothetical protein
LPATFRRDCSLGTNNVDIRFWEAGRGPVKREETMQKTLSYAALAAALAVASPVLAQSPSSGASREAAPQSASPSSSTLPPSASGSPSQAPGGTTGPSATSPSGRDAAANVGASPEVASGMSVKDNTGAVIGQITAVKGDMATIKMGADSFTVDTSKLGVQGGAATINASQAELKKMLPKK